MKRVPVSDVAEINPRMPIDQRNSGDEFVSFVSMADVSNEGYVATYQKRQKSDVLKGYTYFERGDVLTAKITPCMQNGKAAVTDAMPHQVGLGSTEFHVLRPKRGVDARYLFHMIWSPYYRTAAESSFTGTGGQQRVPAGFFERFDIPLPSLSEQKRIAGILDQADGLRRKRQQALALTDQFLRSTFLDLFGDPVTNPKRWPIGTIRDLVTNVNYGTSAKAGEQGKYPVLRMNNLTFAGGWNLADLKYMDLADNETEKFMVRKGDLLFNRTNSKELVGKSAVFRESQPMAFAGYLIRIRPNDRANTEYLAGYLNSASGKSKLSHMCKSIVGMANINAQELQNIPIAIPPREFQDRFAAIVDRTHKQTLRYRRGIDQSNALFNALVQRAFRGEL